jgi:hypothetical protein
MNAIFAQVMEPSVSSSGLLGGLLGAAGGVGFAIWYGWYMTTRTIPKFLDDARIERDKMAAAAAEERRQHNESRKDSYELAVSGHKALGEITRAVEVLTTRIAQLPKDQA